jgi:hypothetical protein
MGRCEGVRTIEGADPLLEVEELARAASSMIANHGRCAASEAEKRAENLLSIGEKETAARWRQIAEAIHRMTKVRPVIGEKCQRRPVT